MQLTVPLGIAQLGRDRAEELALTNLDRDWTFGELAAHSAAVAALLVARGGEDPVAVIVDRSLESVAALIGAWWAGRGVVAVDAADPDERIREMVGRVGASAVVDASVSPRGTLGDHEVLLPPPPLTDPGTWPSVRARPPDTAALFQFTSGSTGRAKCVARSFANYRWVAEHRVGPDDYVSPEPAAITNPLHFATGFSVTLLGLAIGRFTVLADPTVLPSEQLLARLDALGVEWFYATPSLFRAMAGTLPAGHRMRSLRKVWTAGEPLYWGDVRIVRNHFGPHVTLSCGYGVSEAVGTVCTMCVGPNDEIEGDGPLPIGKPTSRDALRLEPVGENGLFEILVTGTLSLGYADDPALTAQRFVLSPDGVRMWRSGDVVSIDESGRLVHRGRVDDMVKIGGKLVEPAEAEAVVRALPGVRDVAVLGRVLPTGRVQLVAHVCVDDSVDADWVRRELRRRLPAHVVPGVLVRHDRLPVTGRGKVDREALRSAPVRPWVSGVERGAVDPEVLTVCALAARVLGLDVVDPDDQLWDLGLDSLGAIELLALVGDAASVQLEPSRLVTVSTCRELAAEVALGQTRRGGHVVEINGSGSLLPWFCVAGGGGTALWFGPLAVEAGADQPVVVFEQFGLNGRGRRDRGVGAVARRNLVEVRRRQPHGPYVFVGHSWGGLVAQEMARLAVRDGDGVCLVLLDAKRGGFPGFWRVSGAPAEVVERRDPWLVWSVKWVAWVVGRVWRAVRDYGVFPGPGTMGRYRSFARTAMRAARRHRVVPLDVGGVLISPVGSPAFGQWGDHPNLEQVVVPGDHFSMMHYPHITAVIEAIQNVAVRPGHSPGGRV